MPRPLKNSLAGLSKESLDEMTESLTDSAIAELLGDCTKNNVGSYRRKLGVKSYGEKNGIVVGVKGVPNSSNRKYSFDESFFASIDSEVKAYALGILLTDGHVTKAGHRVRFSLTEDDFYVIEEIAKAAGYTGGFLGEPPREGNWQAKTMKVLNFNSSLMVNDLKKVGVVSGKDNNLSLPFVPASLEHHLIRGIIDGDGHIAPKDQLSRSCLFEISGREKFLESVNECFRRHSLPLMSITKMKTIHRGRCPLSSIAILDWCYGCNPSIFLRRKAERYKEAKILHDLVFKVQ